MIEKTLARRYAAALLAVADRQNIVEEVESQLLALKEAFLKDAALRATLGQPRVPRALKKRVLRKPFEGRTHPAFLQFLEILVEKGRVDLLPEIADAFDRLADSSRGVVRVKVRTFAPLTEVHQSTLLARLGRITGKKVAIDAEIDRATRGGMSVTIGDTVIDGTVLYRMKVLRERLFETRWNHHLS